MATEEEHVEVDDESAGGKSKKMAKYDSSAADLEKVTDYVEEAEISSQSIGEVSENKCFTHSDQLQFCGWGMFSRARQLENLEILLLVKPTDRKN